MNEKVFKKLIFISLEINRLIVYLNNFRISALVLILLPKWILLNQIFLIFFFITVGLLLIIENYINSLNFICEIKINKEKITLLDMN
jgi:hypothetical protein